MTADQWALREGGNAQMLENVEGGIGLMPEGIQAQLAFRAVTGPAKPLVRMRIVRDRRLSPPAYGFDLDTGGSNVPPSVATLVQILKPGEATVVAQSPHFGVR